MLDEQEVVVLLIIDVLDVIQKWLEYYVRIDEVVDVVELADELVEQVEVDVIDDPDVVGWVDDEVDLVGNEVSEIAVRLINTEIDDFDYSDIDEVEEEVDEVAEQTDDEIEIIAELIENVLDVLLLIIDEEEVDDILIFVCDELDEIDVNE